MKRLTAILITALCLLTVGCADREEEQMDGDSMVQSYVQISQDEAKKMMAREDGHLIVDVRRQDEYDAGHIPGAICVPLESIGTERPSRLEDPAQILLLYCRSGRRSKEAAQKLAELGYTRVYEFGGILDWTGEVVTETVPEDPAPEAEQPEPVEDPAVVPASLPVLVIEANGHTFYAALEDNSSAEALVEKLGDGSLELSLHDYGNFEKVGLLPWSLPRNDSTITTSPGDVILYQGNEITVYYDENTWSFTRMAKIDGATREDLLDAFGPGEVTVTLWVEWRKESGD